MGRSVKGMCGVFDCADTCDVRILVPANAGQLGVEYHESAQYARTMRRTLFFYVQRHVRF